MKQLIVTETGAFLPALGVFCTITPDQMMNDLYNGVSLLLLFFLKGLLATLASLAGRWLTIRWQRQRDRKEPPIKAVNDAASKSIRKSFKQKTKQN